MQGIYFPVSIFKCSRSVIDILFENVRELVAALEQLLTFVTAAENAG